jgi:hypothetical protein
MVESSEQPVRTGGHFARTLILFHGLDADLGTAKSAGKNDSHILVNEKQVSLGPIRPYDPDGANKVASLWRETDRQVNC